MGDRPGIEKLRTALKEGPKLLSKVLSNLPFLRIPGCSPHPELAITSARVPECSWVMAQVVFSKMTNRLVEVIPFQRHLRRQVSCRPHSLSLTALGAVLAPGLEGGWCSLLYKGVFPEQYGDNLLDSYIRALYILGQYKEQETRL